MFTHNKQAGRAGIFELNQLKEAPRMKTPREKYENDPEYHYLVRMLEDLIEKAHFTPSEMREACVLASINYELRHVRQERLLFDPKLADAIKTLDDFVCRWKGRREAEKILSQGGHR
jgi:hypothetical protein